MDEDDWDHLDVFKTHPVISEPLKEFSKHYIAARNTSSMWPHNFVLVTVDSDNQPHGRTVSLHTYDERGFCFCSNYDGPKSQQIAHNPKAAMVFAWSQLETQVRITGVVEKLSTEESDILYNRCRPPEKSYYLSCSQGPDHPFTQSAIITDEKAWQDYRQECAHKYAKGDVPRPAGWGGWRVKPTTIEIMSFEADSIRTKWTKQEDGEWKSVYLAD